jgi:hypothetical protein
LRHFLTQLDVFRFFKKNLFYPNLGQYYKRFYQHFFSLFKIEKRNIILHAVGSY